MMEFIKKEDWNLMITSGFRQIQNSLTELDLDFVSSDMMITPNIIKMSDLLAILPNLLRLVYIVPQPELDSIGDFASMASLNDDRQQYLLKDLDLQLYQTNRRMIEPLLQHCGQLRRLVIQRCMDDFVDLLELYCPNLQILAYNYDTEEVAELDDMDGKTDGLRKLYFSGYSIGHQPRFDHRHIMSLILNNASTMDTIDIGNCSTITKSSDQPILSSSSSSSSSSYDSDNLRKMTNLKSLAIEYDGTHPVAESLLQSIPDYHALTMLNVSIKQNLPRFINNLIALQRPQQMLRLVLPTNKSNNDRTALLQLFQHYSALSTSSASLSSSSLSKKKKNTYITTFETLSLWDATDFLTDQMLNTISNINTITNIELISRSPGISPEGLNVFINKLSQKVTHFRLGGLDIVYDDHLIQLADKLKSLTHIKLEVLENITDYGLIVLMDRAIGLKSILISACPLITGTICSYAKLKHIEFIYEI